MIPRDKSEKKKGRPTLVEAEDDIQTSLERIYRNGSGELPDFASIERNRSSRWLGVITILGVTVIVLSVLAWVGFFAIEPLTNHVQIEGLALTLHEPIQVTLGQAEEITLEWRNDALRPLTSADIRLSFPPEFQFISADPAPVDQKNMRWDLGFVAPHGTGVIKVKGLFLGSLGGQGTVQAVGNFQAQNTDRERQVVVQDALTYKDTVLEGSLHANETVLPGDLVTLQYSLQNKSTQALEGLLARVTIPTGFIPTATTTIDVDTRTLQFRIGTLPAGSLTTIPITGRFSPGASGDAVFLAQAGQERGNTFFPIQRSEQRLTILAGELALRVVTNGASASSIHVSPGEPVRLLLDYQNTSPETLGGVTLSATIETFIDGKAVVPGTLLALGQLTTFPVAASSTKSRVLHFSYTKEQLPLLASLPKGAEGTVEFFLPTLTLKKPVKDASIRITWQSELATIGSVKVARKVALTPIVIQYQSDADVSVETRYYSEEGAPIGKGPLPPLAGNTTAYRVFWQVQKTLHPLEDIEISAELPRISAWSAKTQVDSGTITFDPKTRLVTWKIKRMPEDISVLSASFEVQLTPEPVDVGRFATLLQETSFHARDVLVNETLTHKKPIQTTDLVHDDGAKGKGVVRKAP